VPDVLTPEQRHRVMSSIRSKDTTPELAVRRILHALGFRFRLHDRRIPGKPDLVLKRHGTVVFVHGCFWHRHSGCRHATVPATNPEFWSEKFHRNVLRDQRNQAELRRLGWRVVVIWECAVRKHPDTVAWQLLRILRDPEIGWEDVLETAEPEAFYESGTP